MRKSSGGTSVLIIAIQWKLRGAIGGMSQRFVQYAAHAYDRGLDVRCLTSWSLANHLGLAEHPALDCIDDRRFRFVHVVVAVFSTALQTLAGRFARVHFAGGGKVGECIFFLAAKSGTMASCTFASRTLKMASYDRPGGDKEWIHLLDAADRIDVLNPGNDLHRWVQKISVSACSFPSRLVGKEVQLREKTPLVVFCGAMVSSKNPLLAIRIMDELVMSGVDARLVIFGGGELRADCESLARFVNDGHGIEVVSFGIAEHYFNTLSKATLFLSLQDHDNYPSQSLMEAMAYGCRCICTSDGDTRLMFPAGSNDHALIDSRDPKAFVDACAAFVSRRDPSKINSDHIFLSHNISRFSEYFDRFVGAGRAPPPGSADS